jgi:SAM-dependent methyltransferase
MNAPMSSQFDQYARNYNQVVDAALSATGEGKDYFANARVRWIAERLKRFEISPKLLLDYGCGNGANAELLMEALKLDSLVGVDVSEESIAEARRTAPRGALFLTRADYLPREEADLAYCCGVFHHIPPEDRSAALDYVRRSLRDGGVFTFFEHNPWNPGTRHIMANCEFDQDAITIPPNEAVELLRSAGFEILGREFLFFFPRWLGVFRALEPALAKIPLGGQYVVVGRKPQK